MKVFMKNNTDGVHLMSIGSPEHAVCGDAFDIGTEYEQEDMISTSSKTVTCIRCISEILNCRGVRVKPEK